MTGSAVTLGPPQLSASSVTGVVATGVVTVVTTTNHGLYVGQWVNITGATDGRYDGFYAVTTVANATTFTYQLPPLITLNTNFSTLITPDTNSGPAQITYKVLAQRAVIIPATAGGRTVSIGPDSAAGAFTLGTNQPWNIENPVDSKFDLSYWYANGNSADSVTVLYV